MALVHGDLLERDVTPVLQCECDSVVTMGPIAHVFHRRKTGRIQTEACQSESSTHLTTAGVPR